MKLQAATAVLLAAALRRSNETRFELACHEGNYAVRFVLQGMRAREAGVGAGRHSAKQ